VELNESAIELATAATNLLLAIVCLFAAWWIGRGSSPDRFRVVLWQVLFGLTAAASVLGTLAHGLVWTESASRLLWMALYFCLAMVVALFFVGAFYDLTNRRTAVRNLPWAVAVGIGFFAVNQLFDGPFLYFVIYEAIAMVLALAIYLRLAMARRLAGAATIALAICLNLVAAGVQASDLAWTLGVSLDHNGLFHVLQIVAVGVLASGLYAGFRDNSASPGA
jgi:hypothetical protein